MAALLFRLAAYLVLTAAVAHAIYLEATSLDPLRMFSEWGYTEPLQSLMLLAGMVLLVIKQRLAPGVRALATCLALVLVVLLIRENDQLLELWLPHGVWKYPAALVVAALAVVAWRSRGLLPAQLLSFSREAAFGLMLAGFLTLVFSRLLGRTGLWQAVMGEAYLRPVKNAAEEGVELFALTLLVVAAAEWLFGSRTDVDRDGF